MGWRQEGAPVRIRLLGPLEVEGDDGQPVALGGRQAQALFGLLAVEANRLVPVSRLIDELWGDEPPASARKTVQTYVSRLRAVLGGERLQSSAGGYRLVAAEEEIDAHEFARLVAAGRFEPALELWRGPALSGLEFVPALAGEAAQLEQTRADAIEQRIDAALTAGEHARLVPQLETLVREQPVREALRARLMLALYRSGRQADALDVYRQGRALLADELGLEPTAELRELERRILAHDPALDVRAGRPEPGALPSGTVTFLFTDVEGSTQLLEELGAERYAAELADHRRVLRSAFVAHGGVEVDTQGDAFFVAFPTARGALEAAAQAQAELAGEISVRIGLHTGTPVVTAEGYVGWDVHRAARIAAAGHGGQVLVSQSTAALVDGALLRDLGLHRLKDLAAAERVYQLGHEDFAPLRSLYRTNLPVPATPFLGRERELGELEALAGHESVRLVTVTGAGGIGKTRLALQAAAELAEEHPDGVFWAPLAALRDPALTTDALAQALGTTDELASHIGDRRLLILVDNLEHLLDAAPALGTLLASCPHLQLLVTSRERLAIAGEHEYPLSTLTDADAQQLFTERARALDPAFRTTPAVAELCRRLDNLPLALELAAARTKLFSAEQLVERLSERLDLLRGGRDADARQQTLRATIEWSHELLDPGERQLFARLAVFAGGCTLEAAETVCDADPDRLGSLIDKSLLRRRVGGAGEGRFWMLETIREYALERLRESDDADELRRRHTAFFVELGATAREGLSSRDQRAWLDRLTDEIDNLRAALAWSLDHDVGEGLRCAAALHYFWWARGHGRELARWFEVAFQSADAVSAEIRVEALMTAGNFLWFQLGEGERARGLYAEGLHLARQLGDERAEAWFLMLGRTTVDDEPEQALRVFEQALEMFRRIGDGDGAAMALVNSGGALCDLGQFDLAARRLEEAIAIYESLGDVWGVSFATGGLADVALFRGDAQRASDLYRVALATSVELDNKRGIGYALAGLSCAAALSGEIGRAGTLWAAAELFEDAHGSPMMAAERARYERLLGEAQVAPAFVTAYESGRELTLERALEYALARADVDEPRGGRHPAIAPSR
jgi:predicted ATPase/DNA-binding SARP family transcriptional activator